jgi:hypothetical protein
MTHKRIAYAKDIKQIKYFKINDNKQLKYLKVNADKKWKYYRPVPMYVLLRNVLQCSW